MKMATALMTALLIPATASAQEREIIMPENEEARGFFEQYGFAEAVVVGDTAWLSGVVAGEREGVTFEQGLDGTFQYAGNVLERAGFSWSDVVDITTYHTDLPAQIETVAAVKSRYLPGATHAWTAIDIDRLYPDNGLVEIKIVAKRRTVGD